jgi:hypothetical protein
MDFDSFLTEDGVNSRYQDFLAECATVNADILSRRQLLSLLLTDSYQYLLDRSSDQPEFEIGVATGYSFFMPALARSLFNDEELLYKVYSQYPKSEVLFRAHPKDPARNKYPLLAHIRDDSKTSTEFILRCRRVVSLASNVSIEALFWERIGCAVFDSHVSLKCQRTITPEKPLVIEEAFLNFYALCFNVPKVFWDDYDYLLWRTGHPSELEIYRKHLNYWLTVTEAGTADLQPDSKVILSRNTVGTDMLRGYSTKQVEKMAKEYLRVRESKSWKLTAPLRAIGKLLRGKKGKS